MNRYHRNFTLPPSIRHFISSHFITTHAETNTSFHTLTPRGNPDPNASFFDRHDLEWLKFVIIFLGLVLFSIIAIFVMRCMGTPCLSKPLWPWKKTKRNDLEAQQQQQQEFEMQPPTIAPPPRSHGGFVRMTDLEAAAVTRGMKLDNPFDDKYYTTRREARRGTPRVFV